MQSSRDSSLWRSLAVAFGDGLAFAVGMRLTQAANRQLREPRLSAPGANGPPRSGPTPSIDGIEQNIKRVEPVERTPVAGSGAVNRKVLEAIVSAVEARLAEHSGQVERRLAEQEAKVASELRSVDRQGQSIARHISEDMDELRQQMMAALEESLHRQIAAAVETAVGAAVRAAIPSSIKARLPDAVGATVETLEQQLRAQVEIKDREIGELRQRLADADSKLLELIHGIGQICRQAAGKIGPPVGAPEQEVSGAGTGTPEGGVASRLADQQKDGPIGQHDHPSPGFAQSQKADRLWRVPMVSSLVLTTSGLVLSHFL